MSGMKDDFVGFTYNGVHSSELGILRTSEGSRFNDSLLPLVQDKTVQIPGGDGTYYFGSYYTQKVFTIAFAFDSLTEAQFRRLRSHFGDRKIHPLIFDEAPYKEYQAKVTGSATIKHLCFDVKDGNTTKREYRGEGSIQFTAFYPFARSTKKFLKDYSDANIGQWSEASGMRQKGLRIESNANSGSLDVYDNTAKCFYVYNPGDVPTDFIIRAKFNGGSIPSGSIYLNQGNEILRFNAITAQGSDYGIQINTKLNLIEGIDANNNKTGTLYNDYVASGEFFKIPTTGVGMDASTVLSLYFDLSGGVGSSHLPQIEYNYLYF